MSEAYMEFRQAYANQHGLIPAQTLREINRITWDCSERWPRTVSINARGLLYYEALATIGAPQLIGARPRVTFPDTRREWYNEPRRQNAIEWVAQNPERCNPDGNRFNPCGLRIEGPSIEEMRTRLPERLDEQPFVEDFFHGHVELDQYVSFNLRHLVLDLVDERDNELWSNASRLLERY